MDRPDVIQVSDISKKFIVRKDKSIKERIVNAGRSRKLREEYWALKDLSFTIKAGESIGLAGANGSGKSTLLKILGGILTPDSGEVRVRGRVAALLELGAGFHPDLTGRENVFLNGVILGLSEEQIHKSFNDIVEFSGIGEFIDTQVKFYSSGMYVRLAFAVAVHSDPDILLVDEVLAVGDEPFQQKCMKKIREFQEQGRSIILVSHSAEQIIDVCDKAIILEHGNIIHTGEARDAMLFLHEQYRMNMELSRSKDPDAQHIQLESVEISSPLHFADEGFEYLKAGETLTLDVTLSASKSGEEYALLVDIETDRGRHIVNVDSRRLKENFSTTTATTITHTLSLPDLHLGDGDYNFVVTLLDSEGVDIGSVRHCAQFHVRSDSVTSGVLYIEPSFQTTTK